MIKSENGNFFLMFQTTLMGHTLRKVAAQRLKVVTAPTEENL